MKKALSILLAAILTLSLFAFTASADDEDCATVEALQFDKTPDIDGTVTAAEWGEPTVAHINALDNPYTSAKDETIPTEYTLWFRYTFDGFYVACQTPDDSPCNNNVTSNQIWNGDCLQLRLDPWGCTLDQGFVPAAARDGNYSEDYQEFAVAYSQDDGLCYAYCWHGVMSGMALQSEGGKYAASNDGTTTTYEFFIPWDELVDNDPHVGVKYGISTALLTATQGENDGKYQNWVQWGTGVINGGAYEYGTNRLVLTDKTVFGGASLTDPNPSEIVTKAPIAEAEGDFVLVDLHRFTSQHEIFMEKNEDGGVTFTFSDSNDPYITLPISSQVKINAEEYPYFALYLKTNYVDASGEMFFVTADSGISGFTGGYSVMFDYCDTEGNQVAVVDFSDAWDYAGAVQQFRFDAYDGGCGDPEDVEMTVYAAAFFKNYNDALMFKVEGVNVELDPEYVEYAKDMMEESGETEPATEQKPVETNAETEKATEPAVQTDAPKPADTNKTTEKAPVQPGGKSSNTWIIYVIIGVVAAAAAAVVIIMVTKKKK
ncbi:MAG: hypothetical protein II135_06950 [Clostridia bacterium]|nr:hypothetical protein [Clostridia bacterium]